MTRPWLLDLDAPAGRDRSDPRALTAHSGAVDRSAGVGADGGIVAVPPNRRDPVVFDVWLLDLTTGEQP